MGGASPQDPRRILREALMDLQTFLGYQAAEGVEAFPLDPEILRPLPRRQTLRRETLQEVRIDLGDCQRCRLCQGRKNIVFGVGNPRADLVIVGEAPGRDEDIQGSPSSGERASS